MYRVLIVIDMQNDFVDGALGTKEAQAIVPNVVEKITSFHGNLYVTLDTHKDDYLNTQEGKILPVKHCIDGTSGHEINKKVLESINNKDNLFFKKNTFGSVQLAEHLSHIHNTEHKIDEVELIGICTDICVISNALLIKAFLPEVKLTVDASCCAGVTPDSHKNALASMKMCHINIIND